MENPAEAMNRAAIRRATAEAMVRHAIDRNTLDDFERAEVGDRLAASHYHLSSTVSTLALGAHGRWQRGQWA